MSDIVQLLIFALDDRRYALRLAQVNKVIFAVDWTPLPDAPPTVLGVIDVQAQLVPLFNLRRRFGHAEREIALEDNFIIAQTSSRIVALVVDQTTDILERTTGDIVGVGEMVPGPEAIEGVIQLKDGLVLIHDLDRFLSLEEERTLDKALVGGLLDN